MTPNKKALEITKKYFLDTDISSVATAIKCALIAVKFAKENPLNTDGYNKYLDEVKQEIEKL